MSDLIRPSNVVAGAAVEGNLQRARDVDIQQLVGGLLIPRADGVVWVQRSYKC